MPTHTEKWDLHESIPKLHLGTSALHVHTCAHTHQPCLLGIHMHTHLGLKNLIKSTKAAAIGQSEELLL